MNTKTKPTTAAVASSVAKTPQGKPGAKPAHTPWHWNEETAHRRAKVLDSGNLEICDVYGIDRETRNTNARLIAAAPELLQALKRCVDEIKALANDCLTQAKARQWLENCEPYWNGKSAIQKAEAAQ